MKHQVIQDTFPSYGFNKDKLCLAPKDLRWSRWGLTVGECEGVCGHSVVCDRPKGHKGDHAAEMDGVEMRWKE